MFTSAFKQLAHGTLNWDSQLDTDLDNLENLINVPINLNAGDDLNAFTSSGMYQGASLTNAPGSSANKFLILSVRQNSSWSAQFAWDMTTGALWQRTCRSTTWGAWYRVVDSSTDSGWVTSATGIAASANWTLNSAKYRSVGGEVSLYLNVTRTTSAMTAASAAGLLTTTPIVTLPSGLVPAQSNGLISAVGPSSTATASGYARASGDVAITQGTPGQVIGIGTVLELLGTYAL